MCDISAKTNEFFSLNHSLLRVNKKLATPALHSAMFVCELCTNRQTGKGSLARMFARLYHIARAPRRRRRFPASQPARDRGIDTDTDFVRGAMFAPIVYALFSLENFRFVRMCECDNGMKVGFEILM